MANCLICWPNHADVSTLSGGSWLPALPLNNIKSRFKSQVARSTNLAEASLVINADLGKNRYITSLAFVGHNLSTNATIRIRFWSDAGMTSCVYDSGYVEVWPRWYDTIQLRWGDDNFWNGRVLQSQLPSIPPLFFHVPLNSSFNAKAQSVRAVTFNLKDDTNEDGYVQIGRMYLAEDWTPIRNMTYGATIAWNDPSIVDTSLDGTEYYEDRPKFRTITFTIDNMEYSEGINKALLMTLDRGVTKDFLFVFDPSNSQLLQQRSFVGRLSQLSQLEHPTFRRTSMAFALKEVI